MDDSTPLRELLKGRRGLSFFLSLQANQAPFEYSQCWCQSPLSARFLPWLKVPAQVVRKVRERYGRQRPWRIFFMNVARTFEQPGSLEKGPYYCSLHCRREFACFPFTPAVGPENTVLSTHIRCMFFLFLSGKYFSQWILSEFNGGEFWKEVTTFRISCDTCRPFKHNLWLFKILQRTAPF